MKCIVCEKDLAEDTIMKGIFYGGVHIKKQAGYGSRYDTDSLEFVICDDCIENKEKTGLIKKTDLDLEKLNGD